MKLLHYCDKLLHVFLLISVLLFATLALNSVLFRLLSRGTAVDIDRIMHYINPFMVARGDEAEKAGETKVFHIFVIEDIPTSRPAEKTCVISLIKMEVETGTV
jgi:hypothetical protein